MRLFIHSGICVSLFVLSSIPVFGGALQVAVSASDSYPVAGETLTWTAGIFPQRPGTLRYAYDISDPKSGVVFAHASNSTGTFDWIPRSEGQFTLRVSVVDPATSETTAAEIPFVVAPLTETSTAVFPTRHPLVMALAVNCDSGQVRARFRPVQRDIEPPVATPYRSCSPAHTQTFLLAGLLPETEYQVQAEIHDGASVNFLQAPNFTTGSIPDDAGIPGISTLVSRTASTSLADSFVLNSYVNPSMAVAYDAANRPVWYYGGALLARPLVDSMLFLAPDASAVREIDLAGNVLHELTIADASSQLLQMGQPAIIGLHHDAIRFPNGYTAVLMTIEQLADQGSGLEDVNGDGILVLDPNWNIVWSWNPFQKLDVTRRAVLNERCSGPCATLRPVANDWTHSNSLQLTSDGNLLMSMRSQDWVIKIDYRNGAGTGDVIWRLGLDGDFRAIAGEAYPWFSHQHMATLTDDGRLMLFDNGNTRIARTGGGNSRGQVWRIDERNRTAVLELNIDMGTYSFALGSAELLANGDYYFLSGAVRASAATSGTFRAESVEVIAAKSAPQTDYRLGNSGLTYRSFRMEDLYTP